MTITEQTTISDIAAAVPSSVRVFQRVGIDFCCGGSKPIGVACEEQRLSFADVAREIDAASARWQDDDRDWTREPLHALADHIVATYHAKLRGEMPRLEAMAAKVRRAHGMKASHLLRRLEAIVLELSADLQDHMRKEEAILFPAIKAVEAGERPRLPVGLASPIAVMESEHDHAGALLLELRAITNGYTPPDWACPTTRALYSGLAELEHDMHVHVHLENNVLFPGAIRLADAGARG